ncbi:hypothetical protein ABIC22_001645 [Paenibacillus sp. PvP094]
MDSAYSVWSTGPEGMMKSNWYDVIQLLLGRGR